MSMDRTEYKDLLEKFQQPAKPSEPELLTPESMIPFLPGTQEPELTPEIPQPLTGHVTHLVGIDDCPACNGLDSDQPCDRCNGNRLAVMPERLMVFETGFMREDLFEKFVAEHAPHLMNINPNEITVPVPLEFQDGEAMRAFDVVSFICHAARLPHAYRLFIIAIMQAAHGNAFMKVTMNAVARELNKIGAKLGMGELGLFKPKQPTKGE